MSTNEGSTALNTLEPSHVIVVLPALNEAAQIEACVRSLMVPSDWMARATIVVADGGSADGTPEVIRNLAQDIPNLVLIDNPRRLQSAGVNAAIAKIAGPGHQVMVRCDAHAIYPPGYVRDAAQAVRERDVASVVTAMDATGQSALQRASAWIVDTPLGSGGRRIGAGGRRATWIMATMRPSTSSGFVASVATTRPSAITRTPSMTDGSE